MKSSKAKQKISHSEKRPSTASSVPPHGEFVPVEEYTLFWDQYVKEADAYDKEMVKGMTGDLDTLLIFAGLFSAVNTAFIIDTYKDLKPDPSESTNALLRNIAYALNNTLGVDSEEGGFMVPSETIRVNALFFASLSCSLFAAFGAVLGKQWLNEYERAGLKRSSYQRGMQRHTKYLGLGKYHLELVVQTLPTILQISLFLFLIALCDFLWTINRTVAAVVMACLALTFLFYLITTIISLCDPSSPFTTRFSGMLRGFIRRSRNSFVQPTNLKAAQCVSWLRDQATCFAAVSSMAKAATLLPNSLRSKLELDAQYIGPSLLRSMVSNNVIQSSIISGTLSSTMSILHDVISDWKSISVSPLTKAITRQLQSTLQFITTTDPVSGDLIIRTLAALSSGGERIEMDPPVLEKLLQEPSLDRDGKRAVLTLLWSSLQEIEEIRIRNMSRLPSFLQLGQALSDTMWLNQAHTIPDYDEQRFKFRAWWVKLCPREAWFASAFRKSLEQLKEDPRISHEVKLEGVKALLPTAALQVWNSQHWYKGWTVCRFWYEKEKDGADHCIAQDLQDCIHHHQFRYSLQLDGENKASYVLMPCLWSHHLVTVHNLSMESLVDAEYLPSLVSVLNHEGQFMSEVKHILGANQGGWEGRTWILEAVSCYLTAAPRLLTQDMTGILTGINELVEDLAKLKGLPEEGQQKIRAAQSRIAALLEGELEGDSGIPSQDNVET